MTVDLQAWDGLVDCFLTPRCYRFETSCVINLKYLTMCVFGYTLRLSTLRFVYIKAHEAWGYDQGEKAN